MPPSLRLDCNEKNKTQCTRSPWWYDSTQGIIYFENIPFLLEINWKLIFIYILIAYFHESLDILKNYSLYTPFRLT